MNGDRQIDMTIPEYQGSTLAGPARVGAELRGVRERLGWRLQDIADRLRIRAPFLEAIEAGDLAALPAPAYAAGFIRSYAEAMGLDPEEILRRFRAEGMTRPKQPALTFPEPVPDRAVPPGAIVFIVAVIGIGAYFMWYRHSEHELKMAQMVPAVPAKLAPLAVPKPPTSAPAPKPPAPAQAASAGPAAENAVSQGGTGQASPAPDAGAAPAAMGNATPASLPPNSAANANNGTATGTPGAAPSPVANAALVISATADSWVQVRGPTGTVLFSRVLKAGDTWSVPDQPGLTLTTGNAGGTVLIRDGVAGAPLGNPGAVKHNLPLTKAATPTGATSPAAPSSAGTISSGAPAGATSSGTPAGVTP